MSEQLDPLTGLPQNIINSKVPTSSSNNNFNTTSATGTDPLTGLPVSVIKQAKPANVPEIGLGFATSIGQNLTNVYTDPLSSYKDYDVITSQFSKDWNEQRAENQPWYEQFGFGVAKALTTVGTSVVDGTLGTANGLLSLAFDKDHSFADNTIGQSMDAVNEQMREWFPNYYTKEEQDSLLGSISNPANFIGDKVLGGAAYTVGALATMYLTGGMGVAGGATRGVGMLARAGRAALGAEAGMSELSATYKVAKALKAGENLSKALTSAANTSRYLKLAQQTDVALTMSLSEAAIEARETKKQFIEEKTAEWEAAHYGEQMPDNIKEGIEQSAAAAMNANFGINLAVLGASNALMFGRMSYRKFSGQAVEEDIASGTYKITRGAGEKGIEYAEKLSNNKLLRAFQKGNRIFGTAGKNMLYESFQEGAQFTSNEAFQNYYGKKFSGHIEGGFTDLYKSFAKGLSETFSSTAGLESMLIGAIVGGGSTVITGTGNKQKAQNTKEFLDLANTHVFSNLAANFQTTKENINIVSRMLEAEKAGDTVEVEALRKKLIFNHAYKYDKAGALDYMFEELDDTAKLSEDEFKEKMMYDKSKPLADQTDGKNQQEVIDDIKQNVKETLQLHKDILAISPLTRPTGLFAAMQSDQSKKDFILQQEVDNTYRSMLYDAALRSKVATTEANKYYNELVNLNPEFAKLDKNKLLYDVTVGNVKLNDEGEIEITASREANVNLDKVAASDEKFAEQLNKARLANRTLSATDQVKFDIAMQSLQKALAVKGSAEISFNELRKNSKDRALYVQAKKLKDAEKRAEAAKVEAEQVIENAATSEELENALPDDTPEEILIDARQRAEELKMLEDQAQEEFKNLSDEELESGYLYNGTLLDDDALEDLDPIKAVAFKRERKERRIKKELNRRQANVDPSLLASIQQKENTELEYNQAKENIKEDFIEELEYVLDQVIVDTNGRKFIIQGRVYEIPFINRLDALNFDENGILQSVTLKDTQNNNNKTFYLKTSGTDVNEVINYQNKNQEAPYNINDIIPDAIAHNILTSEVQLNPEVRNIEELLQLEEFTQNPVFEDVEETIKEEETNVKEPNYNINNKSIDKLKSEMVTLRAKNDLLLQQLDKLHQAGNNSAMPFEKFEKIPEVAKILKDLNKLSKIMDTKIEAIQYKQRGNKEESEVDLDTSNDIISDAVIEQQNLLEDVNNQIAPLTEAKKVYDDLLKMNPVEIETAGYPTYTEQDLQYMKDESLRLGRQIGALKRKANYISKKITSIKEKENEDNIARLQQDGEAASRNTVSIEGEIAERANTDPGTRAEEERVSQSRQVTSEEIDEAKAKEKELDNIKTTTEENELILQQAIGQEVQPTAVAPTQPVVILESGRLNLQLTKGEFEGVTESGTTISSNFVNQFDADGNSIPVETDRIAAFGPENVNVGDIVEFVVDENTKWWQENKDKYPTEEHWKHVPIFIVHNGNKVGLLSSYKTDTENGVESVYGTDRKVIYENRNSRPQATVVNKAFNTSNISNATTQVIQPDNTIKTEKHFFNPTELINQGGIGIVTSKGVEVAYNANLNDKDLNLISTIDVESSKLKQGTVVIFGRNPLGEIQTFVATTKNMDEFGFTTIKNHIKNKNFSAIPEILGVNYISGPFISEDLETYDDVKTNNINKLLFLEDFNNELLFSFYSPSAQSFIRVSASSLNTVFNSPNEVLKPKFSFIDIVPSSKEGVSGYDIVINKDKTNFGEVENNVVEELKQVILKKKYQVSKGILQETATGYKSKLNEETSYNSYVEYLTSSNEFNTARTEGIGHNSILTTDIKLNDRGSAWNDVGLVFDNLTTKGKKVITNEEVQRVTIEPIVPSQVPATVQTALEERGVESTPTDDLFAEFGMEEEQPAAPTSVSDIEKRNTFTKDSLKEISDGTGLAKKGTEILNPDKVASQLKIGDKIIFYAERERTGIWDGKTIREDKSNNPFGILGILSDVNGYIKNQSNIDAELAALAGNVGVNEILPADIQALIGTEITAEIPMNRNKPEGVTKGIIADIKINPTKKDAYTITLDNGERVAWSKGNKKYVWVQGMNKSSAASNIKAKKADIERRRQEELKIAKQNFEYLNKKYISKLEEKTNILKEQYNFQKSELLKNTGDLEFVESKYGKTFEDWIPLQIKWLEENKARLLVDERNSESRDYKTLRLLQEKIEEENKINAKYDAELEALEGKPTQDKVKDAKFGNTTVKVDPEKILLSLAYNGFKSAKYSPGSYGYQNAFDPRRGIVEKLMLTSKSFAQIIEYKNKNWLVVGLTTVNDIGNSITSGRDNYSFATIEFNESLPNNIIEILEKAAKEHFKENKFFTEKEPIKPITEISPELFEQRLLSGARQSTVSPEEKKRLEEEMNAAFSSTTSTLTTPTSNEYNIPSQFLQFTGENARKSAEESQESSRFGTDFLTPTGITSVDKTINEVKKEGDETNKKCDQ